MRKAFLEFLVAGNVVSHQQMGQVQKLLRGAPEPIGSIAFSYGMLVGKDIDAILDEQQHGYQPFGEIASAKGLLTREQVDTLLRIQRFRGAAETAEALALSGVCPVEVIMTQLGRFLARTADSSLCAPC